MAASVYSSHCSTGRRAKKPFSSFNLDSQASAPPGDANATNRTPRHLIAPPNSRSRHFFAPAGGTVRPPRSLMVMEPRESTMTEQKQKVLSSGNSGDDRTPDKTIGEVKYARGQDRKKGG